MKLSYKEELSLFVFLICPVAKAAGGARGSSITLATKIAVSPLKKTGYHICFHTYDKNLISSIPI